LWVIHVSILEISLINVKFVVNVSDSVDNLEFIHAPILVRNLSSAMYVVKDLLNERLLWFTVEPMLVIKRM